MGGPFVEWVCQRRKAPADVGERSSQTLCDRRGRVSGTVLAIGPDSPAASILSRSVRFPAGSLGAAVSGRSGHGDARLRTRGKREDRSPAHMGGGDGRGRRLGHGRARRSVTRNGSGSHVIDALADAAGDEVIERVSPAPQLRRRGGGRATPGPARAARGAARAGDRRPARARLRRRARLAGDAADAATATAAGRARDTRGAGARPAPPEARGRADRTARRPTCASRSTRPARCSGPTGSRCRIPVSARCTNAPRDGRPVCAWRRSR